MSQFLTRAVILAVNDTIEREIVNCPEWGGQVLVRGLTAQERDQFEASLVSDEPVAKGAQPKSDLENMRAKLVALSAIDEQGSRLFTIDDVESLGAKAGRPIVRIAEAVQRLSGMTDRDLEELSTAASATTPSDAATGGSPSPSAAPEASSTPASAPESSTSSGPSTTSTPSAPPEPTGTSPSSPTPSTRRRAADAPAT